MGWDIVSTYTPVAKDHLDGLPLPQGRIQDFKRGGGANTGEDYEAMQYLLYLNAGWKDKYLQDRGNLSVPEASTGSISYTNPDFPQDM